MYFVSSPARETNTAGNGGQSGHRAVDISRHLLSSSSRPHSLICATVQLLDSGKTKKKKKTKILQTKHALDKSVAKSSDNNKVQGSVDSFFPP